MENNNQVEKFDPSKLMDGVRDRIKSTFVSLIPDDQWTTMCDAEMKKFFKPRYEKDYYGKDKMDRPLPSELEEMVLKLMRDKCRDYCQNLLSMPEYSVDKIWAMASSSSPEGNKNTMSGHLDKMIKEKMPEMLQSMFTSIMSNAFYELFANAQRSVKQY